MKLCAIFLALTVAWSQTTPSKSIVGEVTGVDASAKQLKVKGDDGQSYIVAFDDGTSYLRMPLGEKDLKKAEKIALSDVTAGDRVLARGSVASEAKPAPAKTVIIMTKADVAKKQEHDRAEWQRRGVAGTVMLVNPNTKEITINTHGRDAKTVVIDASAATGFRRYAADSVRFADTKPSSLAELQPGDTIRALGDKNEDGTRFKAEELVSGSFQTIAAVVVSADPATGEVRVTDLQTKKPVTVKTNQSSMLRRLDERTAGMLARRMRGDAGGPAGTPGGPGAASGAPGAERAFEGRGGNAPGGGAPGGPGGRGNMGGGGGDLQQVLDRSPQLSLAELKKGDALIISSSKAADGSAITAMSLVAGVEPFLAAAPRTAGQVNLGSWNIEMNMPEQ